MADTVNISDAKTHLSKLVDRAAAGEEIVIAKAGKPKAKLVPYQPPRKKRRFGRNLLGITYIADDFDEPCRPRCRNISSRIGAAADRLRLRRFPTGLHLYRRARASGAQGHPSCPLFWVPACAGTTVQFDQKRL
jgi:prevent-host-death family protein